MAKLWLAGVATVLALYAWAPSAEAARGGGGRGGGGFRGGGGGRGGAVAFRGGGARVGGFRGGAVAFRGGGVRTAAWRGGVGRGFYGRGFYGRGFYGRGFYGRGFYGRGFYGRGFGRGFYGGYYWPWLGSYYSPWWYGGYGAGYGYPDVGVVDYNDYNYYAPSYYYSAPYYPNYYSPNVVPDVMPYIDPTSADVPYSGISPNGTYLYNGGPAEPIPQPLVDPASRSDGQTRYVSQPAKPKKYVYRAYGEKPDQPPRKDDGTILTRRTK
jgi:hypothetical protein